MKATVEENIKDLKEYIKKIDYLNSAIAVLYWDMRTYIPKKGVPYRSDVVGYLSSEAYKLETSDKVKEYIDYFEGVKGLNDVQIAMVQNMKRDYEKSKLIPEEKFVEFTTLQGNSEAAWQEAKLKSDYSIFKPYLKKLIDLSKEFAGYWGFKNNKYDGLLDRFEPGLTTEKVDTVFGDLKKSVIDLLNKIEKSDTKINTDMFKGNFSVENQQKLGNCVLEKMGYDFDAGRVDKTLHGFTINFCNKDVRITTDYDTKNFISSFFTYMHEGGHALYEMDIPDDLRFTGLSQGASMSIHESQSRFYENIIGKSREFWTYFYPEVIKIYPEFQNVPFGEFYHGVNKVEPSLIRVDADELTYNLHIIIRYEIEKMMINGDIDVDDLPSIWNQKYKEYLGVTPPDDAHGILQDIHWSSGDFGYFPSYALGNLYGAQFMHAMKKDVPDIMSRVQSGDLKSVRNWLSNNVHKYGKTYTPSELVKKATGEELNAKYFIDYINNKFSEIYNLH